MEISDEVKMHREYSSKEILPVDPYQSGGCVGGAEGPLVPVHILVSAQEDDVHKQQDYNQDHQLPI